MASVRSAIEDTVPISQFNRGMAGTIFEEVKKTGPRVVMKNNKAEAVIVSPKEYIEIQDELNDYLLLTMAVERMSHYDPDAVVSQEEMDQRLGITEEDLNSEEDEVEIE